jgi:G3E family GTPase
VKHGACTVESGHTPSSQYRSRKEAHRKHITRADKISTENIKIYITKKVFKVIRKSRVRTSQQDTQNKIQQGNHKHWQRTKDTPVFLTSTTRRIKNEDIFDNIIILSCKF